MNGFLIFSLATVLSLTLVKPFCVIARDPVYVGVQNSFRDGRVLAAYCFSSDKRSNSHEILLDKTLDKGESESWIEDDFDGETLDICQVTWPIRFINGVKYKFKAFKGSWSHGNFIRDHFNGVVGYHWMFNETGFFGFVYSLQIFRRVATMQQLMSSAWFLQPVTIFLTNGFTDGRTVGIHSLMSKGDRHQTIAHELVKAGAFRSWTIHKFKITTIIRCKVGWSLLDDQFIYSFQFEAFVGSWIIDISSVDPATGRDQYAWLLNETGTYLRNFGDDGYQLKLRLYR